MKSTGVPHIDLNNFESEKFVDCDYVLTSPTSLEACRNLGIRPSDLLASASRALSGHADGESAEKERKMNIVKAKAERQRLLDEWRASRQNLAVRGLPIGGNRDCRQARDDDTSCRQRGNFLDSRRELHTVTSGTGLNQCYQGEARPNSVTRELNFFEKRRQLEEMAKDDRMDLKRRMEMRLARVERNKNDIQRQRTVHIENRRRSFEKRLDNVSHRRQLLDNEILNYYRELERYQSMTLRLAQDKIDRKWQYEQNKIQAERGHKELVNRHNRELLQREQEDRSQEIATRIMDKERQNQQFMQERLDKMVESRCYANEAQKIREEIRKIYNLDSFDKKANYAEIVNQVIR